MLGYYVIAGLIFIVSLYVSNKLKSKFKKYSQVHLQNGLSGKEIAEKMLYDNGITDVQVISTPGMLTDHYNPAKKTVNLSEAVYTQRNAAAAAVSAHEVGHAIQHAKAYGWLQMRSQLVPVVSVASKYSMGNYGWFDPYDHGFCWSRYKQFCLLVSFYMVWVHFLVL
jgi:uncharacterized protein